MVVLGVMVIRLKIVLIVLEIKVKRIELCPVRALVLMPLSCTGYQA